MLAISAEPIDAVAIESSLRSPRFGGIVTFTGVVREFAHDGRPVTALAYEAHEGMALAEFEKIAEEAAERYGELGVAIVHRIGELRVGEVAVVVCVGAPHRDAAFGAARYAIDELKRRAPIWKKEFYTDGASDWISNEC